MISNGFRVISGNKMVISFYANHCYAGVMISIFAMNDLNHYMHHTKSSPLQTI